jgi:hypothetical protein
MAKSSGVRRFLRNRLFRTRNARRTLNNREGVQRPEASRHTCGWSVGTRSPRKRGVEGLLAPGILHDGKNGSSGRTRTCNLVVNSHPLCRLSYRGAGCINLAKLPENRKLMGAGRSSNVQEPRNSPQEKDLRNDTRPAWPSCGSLRPRSRRPCTSRRSATGGGPRSGRPGSRRPSCRRNRGGPPPPRYPDNWS